MVYDDFEELPISLKFLTLVLYIISVPLFILGAVNFAMLKYHIFNLPNIYWIISGGILFGLSLFSYLSALALNRLKAWAPTFFYIGITSICIGILIAQFLAIQIFSFIEINFNFFVQCLCVLIIAAILVEKNRGYFKH